MVITCFIRDRIDPFRREAFDSGADTLRRNRAPCGDANTASNRSMGVLS